MRDITINPNITIANTPEARSAFERFREHIEAAAQRFPVVIGPQGVVFYDQREFYPNGWMKVPVVTGRVEVHTSRKGETLETKT